MSRIHCGWCGEKGHHIHCCKDPAMEQLYDKHKTNGMNCNKLQLPYNEKLHLYMSSTSTYSFKEMKAIASYIGGIENIGRCSRMELSDYICRTLLNADIVHIPKVAFMSSPLIKMNCGRVIKSTEETQTESTEECCVCLNNITSDMFVKFTCNHNTCIDCFKELIKCKTKICYFPTRICRDADIDVSHRCHHHVNCPMCRSIIETVYSENDVLSNLQNEHVHNHEICTKYYLNTIKNIIAKTMIK